MSAHPKIFHFRYLRMLAPAFIILVVSLNGPQIFAQAVRNDISELRKMDVVEHPDARIPLDLTFVDDSGKTVTIGDYFNQGKPVILDMAYYTCPMLCNLVMNGIAQGVKQINLLPGRDFQIVTVSIDPRDSVSLAAAKRANYLKSIGKPGIDAGWRFLTGPAENSKALADALGFEYYYDEAKGQYAHPAVIFVLTADGRISRYLYGIEFKPNDLRLALLEASEGKIGNTVDRILLYCYHYDPEAKGYVLFAANVMKLGGLITLVLLTAILAFLWIREHHKKSAHKTGTVGQSLL
ncbi:Electron transport protein SCO1/SenC [Candidatus Zixiibacteriota bacterium]|nr:Electron transport protein SCO1/SenC [candidate division Zixibacteria bacterium]